MSVSSVTRLVRPQLEYASTVWNNSVKCTITKIESVQRNAACFTCRDYQQLFSVSSVLQKLNWDTLEQRRACVGL